MEQSRRRRPGLVTRRVHSWYTLYPARARCTHAYTGVAAALVSEQGRRHHPGRVTWRFIDE